MNKRVYGLLSAVALSVVVSGCGEASEAAIVNGTSINDQALQQAAQQITEAVGQDQTVTAAQVLPLVIAGPTIHQIATKAGKPVSDAAARAAFTNGTPNDTAVSILRANAELRGLSEAQQQQVATALKDVKVTVNPRYGTFAPEKLALTPPAPNWLVPVKVS